MIPTTRELPLRSETPMDPLHDECSGIAQLDQRRHGGGAVVAVALLSAAFSMGMLAGALIVFGLVVIFTN